MDKILNKLLNNPYTRSLLILVVILVLVGTTYFTLASAQSYLEYDFLRVGGGALIEGFPNGLGLIVTSGSVGFGVSEPEGFEVTGDVNITGGEINLNSVKFTPSTISHLETSKGSQTYTYWTGNNFECRCGEGIPVFDTESRRYSELESFNLS